MFRSFQNIKEMCEELFRTNELFSVFYQPVNFEIERFNHQNRIQLTILIKSNPIVHTLEPLFRKLNLSQKDQRRSRRFNRNRNLLIKLIIINTIVEARGQPIENLNLTLKIILTKNLSAEFVF